MTNPFAPAQIDFSALGNLLTNYRGGQQARREDNVRDAFSEGLPRGPNGEIDFGAAYDTLAQANPAAALQGLQSNALTPYQSQSLDIQRSNAASLDAARRASAVPADIRLYDAWQARQGGGAQPNRLGPPQAGSPQDAPPAANGGVEPFMLGPGDNPANDPANAPAFLADKFLSISEKERLKGVGKDAADRAAKDAKRPEVERAAGDVLSDLWNQVSDFDSTTVQNALGPLQGGGPTAVEKAAAFPFQLYGSARNAIPFIGGEGNTDEVRGAIAGSAEALGAVIKPFVRQKGEGPWTDADQARLIAIAGDLQRARDKPEFERRMRRAISRINAAWDLDIDPDQVLGGRRAGPGGAVQVPIEPPPMDMAVDPPSPDNDGWTDLGNGVRFREVR